MKIHCASFKRCQTTLIAFVILSLTASAQNVVARYDWAYSFSEGYALVNKGANTQYGYPDGGKWGYIDINGKEISPIKYDEGASFSNGLARVGLNGKFGYINRMGKEVITLQFEQATDFSEGLAAVKQGEEWIYIDTTGKAVITGIGVSFYDAYPFHNGLAHVVPDEHINGERIDVYINRQGETVIFPGKGSVIDDFCEGFAFIKRDYGHCGYINRQGKEIVPFIYLHCYDFYNGLAGVQNTSGIWGFIDTTGKVIIPFQFEDVRPFSEGLSAAKKKNSKWGFIDYTGKEIIPAQFEFCYEFHEGLCEVISNKKVGYIDKTGKLVIPYTFDAAYYFANGWAPVKSGNEWGYVDKNGKSLF